MWNPTVSRLLAVVALWWAAVGPNFASAEPVTLLHSFAGGKNDGSYPQSGLTLSGTTLFGTAWDAWSENDGVVFSINTDGTGYKVLHKFTFSADKADGMWPTGRLTLSGTTLFGTTRSSNRDGGTIFSINTDGTGFKLLREIAGMPEGGLTLVGTTLFGSTSDGDGTLFSINTDGSDMRLLHRFKGGINDGRGPNGGLVSRGAKLFGTTDNGGDSDQGTVFSVNNDGTGFALLHEFAGRENDGSGPNGGQALSGATLFGTAWDRAKDDGGAVFSMNTDGTDFRLLRRFGGRNNGKPNGDLTLTGTKLLGTKRLGGKRNRGTIFSIDIDGTGFEELHKFDGGNDGSSPNGGLILTGGMLFGTTDSGGDRDRGTIFSFPLNAATGGRVKVPVPATR
jgi:uncharacterized repeat protein (TIGR03803 family)